jgi:hypothetical protein
LGLSVLMLGLAVKYRYSTIVYSRRTRRKWL